ncbi:MAG: hypothetical protein LRY55_14125 [Leadbetterella sp.]|nr:hypothetical protein [Leadbetterella sp.]
MKSDWTGFFGVLAVLTGAGYILLISLKRAREAAGVKAARLAISYPLQLQAGERMILFLERIKPQNLLTRIPTLNLSSTELQQVILQEIRAELDHNAAQQLYIGKDTWKKISAAATATSAALVHAVAERSAMRIRRRLWSVFCKMKMPRSAR